VKILIAVALLFAIGTLAVLLLRSRSPRLGEVLPADEMKKKYGLTAENRPLITISPTAVPPHLRDLIPMAEKWGIGDDIIRTDVERKASESEKAEFRDKLRGRTKEVSDWLDSFKTGEMSREAAHFMRMLEALDEMHIWPDR
jgi:hypothetical protein